MNTKQTLELYEQQCGSAIKIFRKVLGVLTAHCPWEIHKKEISRPSVTIKRHACGAFLYLSAGFTITTR